MMTFENPETFGQTVFIAPAEGQKPLVFQSAIARC